MMPMLVAVADSPCSASWHVSVLCSASREGSRRRYEQGYSRATSKNTLYCSFCGKSQHEVRKLIAGPTVFICDECVELCMDIIREENKSSLVKSKDGVPTPAGNPQGAR